MLSNTMIFHLVLWPTPIMHRSHVSLHSHPPFTFVSRAWSSKPPIIMPHKQAHVTIHVSPFSAFNQRLLSTPKLVEWPFNQKQRNAFQSSRCLWKVNIYCTPVPQQYRYIMRRYFGGLRVAIVRVSLHYWFVIKLFNAGSTSWCNQCTSLCTP